MKKKESSYSAQHIEVLEGLEPVRRRPGMYTDTASPLHLLQELIDNSVDEALSGYASEIVVTLHDDQKAFSVADNGRGMPIDIHPIHKKPAIDLILSTLHSGAKFSKNAYDFSGGLHGVGISVVNALSQELSVQVIKDHKIYETQYRDGVCVSDLKKSGHTKELKSGTIVFAYPNPQYFEKNQISLDRVKKILRTKALLCPNLTLKLIDQDFVQTWCYPGGLEGYMCSLNFSEPLWKKPWIYYRRQDDYEIHIALVWAQDVIIDESFVNLIPTVHGGAHVQMLKSGLLEALKDYTKNLSKSLKDKIIIEDMSAGMNWILSLKIHDPNFQGQTKEKLGSLAQSSIIGTAIKNAFLAWLFSHYDEAQKLMEWIDARQQQRLLSAQIKSIKKTNSAKLPAKLSDCTSKNFYDRELYLVEGDSAGSSAKQARDKETQAILPLRGKVLNTWELKSHKACESQEVQDIMATLGIEPMSDDLSRLRYNRICLLSDADSDGSHIVTLLCALFVKHFPALVRQGHLYVAQPPLYRIDIGKEHFYARTLHEQEEILARYKGKNYTVLRFKGLGEMNPSQLKDTTLNPQRRILIQLSYDELAEQYLDLFMSKSRAADRKKWLESSESEQHL